MAAVFDQQETEWKPTGKTVTVPPSPKAKLMYYFNCVCSAIHMHDDIGTQRLRDFSHFYHLTESETDRLLILCILLSPEKLVDKCFFQDDDLCMGSDNEFYELGAVQSRLLVTEYILLGGRKRHVTKVMCFKKIWIQNNYFEPLNCFTGRLERLHRELLVIDYKVKSRRKEDGGCCTIM